MNPPVIRRARPLLGTIVEITVRGMTDDAGSDAIRAAFSAVEKVQALMSYHDPLSELSRLNFRAARHLVQVSPWMFSVLEMAQQLAEESDGVFDVTIAPRLASWGFLPRNPPNSQDERLATWRDIELTPGRLVRFRRPLHMDLGGIAKGFAVDQAIAALHAAGAPAGIVNAGGDLRGYGPEAWPVVIRHPSDPQAVGHIFSLHDSALATSANYFTRRRWRGCDVCPLVDGRTRLPCADETSASVLAPGAMLADALTKILVASRETAAPILQRHGATGMLLDRAGQCAFIAVEKTAPVPA